MEPLLDDYGLATPYWMESSGFETPPGSHVALAPGVLVYHRSVRRAQDLDDVELSPPPPPSNPFEPPFWHPLALCYGSYQPGTDDSDDPFFSDDRRKRVTLANRAKVNCWNCPVITDCLGHALEQREEFGIWGATSGLQRKFMLARIDAGESTIQLEVDTWLARRR